MYIIYTMYTIVEFRKNIRKAFNDAHGGHEVVIERYGQKYQLVSLVDKALSGYSFESTPSKLIEKDSVEPPVSEGWNGPLYRNKKKGKL